MLSSKCSAFAKKNDVAQIEKIPARSENRVSALLQLICLQGFDIHGWLSYLYDT